MRTDIARQADRMDLSRRSSETELMDEGGLSFAEFQDCLEQLEWINAFTLAYRPTLAWIKPWLRAGEPLSILDAGSGGGDMLRRIDKLAGSRELDLIGVDLNPWSKCAAERLTESPRIRYATADIFHFEAEQPVDIIISSLFTHHLAEEQLLRFLRWMHARARRGWFINDLHRHPLPYQFIKVATRLCSRNRLIRNDAALSVARAFTRHDWQRLLERAGLGGLAQVSWHFPFRLCVACNKSSTRS